MGKSALQSTFERPAVALYDTSYCVKSWGRRGILAGGIFGFALGAAFVAVPLTSDVLTFGVVGTLIVAAVEGAAVAGIFSACAAALYGKSVRYGRESISCRTLSSGWRPLDSGWHEGDIPQSDWPTKRTLPAPPTTHTLLKLIEQSNTTEQALQSARTQLSTIDAWDIGTTGP